MRIGKRIHEHIIISPLLNSYFQKDYIKQENISSKKKYAENSIVSWCKKNKVFDCLDSFEQTYHLKRKQRLYFSWSFKGCCSYGKKNKRQASKNVEAQPQLSANAGIFITSPISITKDYTKKILFDGDNSALATAFLISIGHELSHKLNDKGFRRYTQAGPRYLILQARITEVYNDFFAVMLFGNSSKHNYMVSAQIKWGIKWDDLTDNEIEDICNEIEKLEIHPSHIRRCIYINKGRFDRDLIEVIAKDVGIRNLSERQIRIALRDRSVITLRS